MKKLKTFFTSSEDMKLGKENYIYYNYDITKKLLDKYKPNKCDIAIESGSKAKSNKKQVKSS